jgi:hypothetical protein
MLTLRQVGAVGIKLLGVTYLARTVLAAFTLLSMRFAPSSAGPVDDFATAQIVGALGLPVVAWLLLGTAEDLAERLFPEVPAPFAIERHDVLVVGLTLMGLSLAASAIPALLHGFGLAVYYGEATRQAVAEARFEREWPELIREGLNLLVGLAIAVASRPLAARFRN